MGPSEEELSEMLRQIGYDSLESLIDATVPEAIRFDEELDLPEPDTEFEVLRNIPGNCSQESSRKILHRPRLPRLRDPACDPAEYSGKTRLVHRLHSLSGRNRPGTSRSSLEFPDHGDGSDGYGDRQCLFTG